MWRTGGSHAAFRSHSEDFRLRRTRLQERRRQPAAIDGRAQTTAYTYNLAGQGESETITGGILDGVVIDPGHDALLRRTSLNAGGAGWTYQQTYGFDPAGRLNAIGFGDHAFSYGYVPNSNLIQTVTSRTAGNDVLTATKTWDNLNRLYRIQSTSTATVGGLRQTFTHARQTQPLVVSPPLVVFGNTDCEASQR